MDWDVAILNHSLAQVGYNLIMKDDMMLVWLSDQVHKVYTILRRHSDAILKSMKLKRFEVQKVQKYLKQALIIEAYRSTVIAFSIVLDSANPFAFAASCR